MGLVGPEVVLFVAAAAAARWHFVVLGETISSSHLLPFDEEEREASLCHHHGAWMNL
jgi:hypothetical protein